MTEIPAPVPMEEMPLEAASILSGCPEAAAAHLYTTPDGRASIGVFRCTPGMFRHTLEADEFTHILSGRMVIKPDGSPEIDATAGHTFILPAGKSMLIDVRETVTDIYMTWRAE